MMSPTRGEVRDDADARIGEPRKGKYALRARHFDPLPTGAPSGGSTIPTYWRIVAGLGYFV